MDDFVLAFEDRLQEIEVYLELLDALEQQIQDGPPRIGETGPIITVQQQRILYSSVYLQLYNLVESTVTRCIEAISSAATQGGRWQPSDLTAELRREWVRFTARTHVDLNYDNRLIAALHLCNHLLESLPISDLTVEKGGGGNWDDIEIQTISGRLGLTLRLSREVYNGVRRPFRDDKGPLAFIKSLRNSLAHGSLSFVECGEGVTAQDLRALKELTAQYLREVVVLFKTYIDEYAFLRPECRPGGVG
jgi:hypothetical protein